MTSQQVVDFVRSRVQRLDPAHICEEVSLLACFLSHEQPLTRLTFACDSCLHNVWPLTRAATGPAATT